MPVQGTLYPVGRLDVDSEGLILLTNDGELTNKLTHPRYGHEKEYRVLIARHPDDKQLNAWRHGVVMEDGYRTAPVQVDVETRSGEGTWVRVIMKEGRKRQIRDTCGQIGLPVVRIIRVRIGTIRLGNLKSKEWRYLTPCRNKWIEINYHQQTIIRNNGVIIIYFYIYLLYNLRFYYCQILTEYPFITLIDPCQT